MRWLVYLVNGIQISSDNYSFGDIPNYPIIKIKFFLPNQKTIVLDGFDAYCIIQTDYHIMQGGKGKIFDTLNFLGLKDSNVYQISYHRKGRVFQCRYKNEGNWTPLEIKTLPKRDKTEKKRFEIQYSKPQHLSDELWHKGVWSPSAKVYIKS